ncbi:MULTISPECIES: sigma 54-interacting transcriptional regulator [unclassified Raoultella]|uniref:sigma 54-interacting transcriptional regulator n=1 Tax=unclassified Raoultella TaxID=2627600 RepID=UPI00135BD861|nr:MULTISPECIES: sigma 54-interacting transcriptional regulator [unclassified Raoultella]
MAKIAVISPSSQLTMVVESLLVERDLPIILAQASEATAVIIARRLIENGIEILISRGKTAELLRESVPVPVIEIRHTFLDCFNAYQKARKYSDNVVFLATSQAYEKILSKALPFLKGASICKIDAFDKIETISSVFEQLRNNNINVVVGGLSLQNLAITYGMHYVMSEADPDSIEDAMSEALHLLKVESDKQRKNMELKKRYEMISAILNCVSEGLLSIDSKLKITNINEFAARYLTPAGPGEEISHETLRNYFLAVLQSGQPVSAVLIETGRYSLSINIAPVMLHDSIVGAVASIQNQSEIKKIEQKMRLKHSETHIADKKFKDIIGNSPALLSAKALAEKYARVESTVMIEGETGTGKELFAQSIHNASVRASGPFVAINCASFAASVIESELFGYVKGAFTGALQEGKTGVFEQAHGGTIFLDEISELSIDIQLKLLRTLQERKIIRLGDNKTIPVDIRIITASNKNLMRLIEQGKFREDFYYRICVLRLTLPSLQQRRTDIPPLAMHLLRMQGHGDLSFSNVALHKLSQRKWPGNIRQLSNIIERLIVVAEDNVIDEAILDDVLADVTPMQISNDYQPDSDRDPPDEKHLLMNALRQVRGNRQQAAKLLGISSTTLWRRIKKYQGSDPIFFETIKYREHDTQV